jgi:hypothetical protein
MQNWWATKRNKKLSFNTCTSYMYCIICSLTNVFYNFLLLIAPKRGWDLCIVNKLHSRVEFYNQDRQIQGYCTLPFPEPQCYSFNRRTHLIQNKNVTKLTVIGIDSKINGLWSCHRGTTIGSHHNDMWTILICSWEPLTIGKRCSFFMTQYSWRNSLPIIDGRRQYASQQKWKG